MEEMDPFDSATAQTGPCSCGSGLPPMLCCLARDTFGGSRQPVAFAATEATDATAVAQWDLALATVTALASVLPEVPVPLLGNRTPRALYAAGPDERAAALAYVDSVAQTAAAVGVAFPVAELTGSLASAAPGPPSPEQRQQIALAALSLEMLARGFDPSQVLGGHRLLRDAVRALQPTLRKPLSYAAAADYACCWMHFRPEGRDEVAGLYGVSVATVSKHFAEMKHGLKLVWYDPRYAVQEPAWQEMLEQTARALAEGEDEPACGVLPG